VEKLFWLSPESETDDDLGPIQAGDYELTLELTLDYQPVYLGSDEYEAQPGVDISGRYWFTEELVALVEDGTVGLGYRVLPMVLVTTGITYEFGRQEDDSDDLSGMGDIDDSIHATLDVRGLLGPLMIYATAYRNITSEDLGTRGEVGLEIEAEAVEKVLEFTLEWSFAYADDQATDTVFGVDAVQSARSGYGRFDPDAGFYLMELGLEVEYFFTSHWSITAEVEYTRLLGDAADSPLTRDRNGYELSIGPRYTF
jgi:outer membrane scaffolding protein for murein synthesis (MipA/OmpV family)